MSTTIPIFSSLSIAETSATYQRIGFQARQYGDGYVILWKDGVELHFAYSPTLKPSESIAAAYIRTETAEEVEQWSKCFGALHWPATGIPRQSAIRNEDHGMREFNVVDPMGNLIRIGVSL